MSGFVGGSREGTTNKGPFNWDEISSLRNFVWMKIALALSENCGLHPSENRSLAPVFFNFHI